VSSLSLQSVLLSNPGVSNAFAATLGSYGSERSIAVVLANDLPAISCDGYVLAHTKEGVPLTMSAGHHSSQGFNNYLARLGRKPLWGDMQVVEGAAGESPHRINVVAAGFNSKKEAGFVIDGVTKRSLFAANQAGTTRLVLPSFGSDESGELEPYESANAILGAINTFCCDAPECGPQEIVIVAHDSHTMEVFKQVLIGLSTACQESVIASHPAGGAAPKDDEDIERKTTVDYTGPSMMEQMFVEFYHQISGNFNRRRPKIIVGLPPDTSSLSSRVTSGHSLYQYIEQQLTMFKRTESIIDVRNVDVLSPQLQLILHRLKRTSFAENSLTMLNAGYMRGGYSQFADTVIVDPYDCAMHFLFGDDIWFGIPIDIYGESILFELPRVLEHELVHYDLGTTLTMVQQREYCRKAENLLAADKGELDEHSIRFWTQLLKREAERYRSLALDIGNEALAHGFSSDRDRFSRWVFVERQVSQEVGEKAIMLYEMFREMIATKGKRTSIGDLHEAMDIAYINDMSLFDFYL